MSLANISRTISSLVDTARVAFGETWASITTTWASETRTWDQTATLLTDTSRHSSTVTNVSKPA